MAAQNPMQTTAIQPGTAPELPEELRPFLRPNVPKYRDDLAGQPGAAPLAVLAPRTAQDCKVIFAALRQAGLRAVIQGGRTGLSGGARVQPGEVVISSELLTAPPHIDPIAATMVVGAGVVLEVAQNAASQAGLSLAADLGGRGSATLGGMAATNAGGPLALRYGSFRQQVLGVEAVLADGTIIHRLAGLSKDNSGFDLSQLMIGTEGCLGIITRLTLRLQPALPARQVALCALPSVQSALELLPQLRQKLGASLQACELILDPLLGEACASRGLLPPFQAPAAAAVLIEVSGQDTAALATAVEGTVMQALEAGLIEDAVLAHSERDCQRLWALREGCSHHLFALPATTSLDLSLPIAAIPAFLSAAEAALPAGIAARVFGHLGDGNLHYVLLASVDDQVLRPLFTLLARHGGVISAEHGIGLDKVGYLPLSRSADELAAMTRLKTAFDPQFLLNAGRVIPAPQP